MQFLCSFTMHCSASRGWCLWGGLLPCGVSLFFHHIQLASTCQNNIHKDVSIMSSERSRFCIVRRWSVLLTSHFSCCKAEADHTITKWGLDLAVIAFDCCTLLDFTSPGIVSQSASRRLSAFPERLHSTGLWWASERLIENQEKSPWCDSDNKSSL